MTGGSILDSDISLKEPVSLFLVQAIVIVTTSQLLAIPLAKLNQPRVIAEVLGGILLGNSALSRIDSFRNSVFPTESLPSLKLVANFGKILFLFLVNRAFTHELVWT
jgi:Kef-type K+ transport system membrane component KefB